MDSFRLFGVIPKDAPQFKRFPKRGFKGESGAIVMGHLGDEAVFAHLTPPEFRLYSEGKDVPIDELRFVLA